MGEVFQIQERDIPILEFIWKWKVSTTAALAIKFFPNFKLKTAYNRLNSLRSAGYIKIFSDRSQNISVWTLNAKGFAAIRNRLPLLQEEGFLSEHVGHDLVCSAVHLGEWLLRTPENVEMFSEQQLRRVHTDYYPYWVPAKASRKPDGYWRITIGDSKATIALEVELTPKLKSEYGGIGEFYAGHPTIFRTLWITKTQGTAAMIADQIQNVLGSKPFIHNFVTLLDFQKHGWDAKIFIGPDQNKTIASFLRVDPGYRPGNYLALTLLDTRKSLYASNASKIFQVGDFF